jgi:hypothetical protein
VHPPVTLEVDARSHQSMLEPDFPLSAKSSHPSIGNVV